MANLQAQVRALIKKEAFCPRFIGFIFNPFYLIRRALFLKVREAAPRFHGRVMDFGCGSKPYVDLFVNADEYVGVDIRVSGHNHSESLVDVFYDGKTLPFNDDAFDGIVSFEVMEHVFNPEEVLRELRRVLKPEGLVLITTPFAWDEHEKPYDYARYTSFGMKYLLEKCGFQVIAQSKSQWWFPAICQILISFLHQRYRPPGRLFGNAFQILIIFPLTLFSSVISVIVPRGDDYYCNLVTVAKRV
jgi:SAM-dependent methyltransferase